MNPKIGIVCCTYLKDNQKYLNECLKSIKNLNYPQERLDVIVISSGDYVPFVDGSFRSIHQAAQMHYPESCNLGVSQLGPVDHYLLLNDDTILSKDSLTKLVEGALALPMCIHQPISTCDNWFRYILDMPLGLNRRFYRYEDFKDQELKWIQMSESAHKGFMIVDWVPLYATLIPKLIWDKVGPLDENFKTGQDDVDYGRRARANGFGCVINLSSFIFHFGGVTADVALTPEIRNANVEYFRNKYNGDMPI